MTEGQVLDIAREALFNIIICAAPPLLVSLVVGLIISIFQTVTSIQEQTLTFVPKIIAVFLSIIVFGSWILNNLTGFMEDLRTIKASQALCRKSHLHCRNIQEERTATCSAPTPRSLAEPNRTLSSRSPSGH